MVQPTTYDIPGLVFGLIIGVLLSYFEPRYTAFLILIWTVGSFTLGRTLYMLEKSEQSWNPSNRKQIDLDMEEEA